MAAQKAARCMLCQEKQRLDARHLKRILAKVQGGAITHIKVSEDGTYVEKQTVWRWNYTPWLCAPHALG
jgi:hypothetical protein